MEQNPQKKDHKDLEPTAPVSDAYVPNEEPIEKITQETDAVEALCAEPVPEAAQAPEAQQMPEAANTPPAQETPKVESEAKKSAQPSEPQPEAEKPKAKETKEKIKAEKKEKKAPKEPPSPPKKEMGAARPPAQKRYYKRVRTKPRSYWIRRSRRRYLRRTTGRTFRFLVAMLLGVLIAFGSLGAGIFFAVGGLTIDTLQRFGMAEGADQYLTDSGEVDLTAVSILELINDLNAVRGNLGAHTLNSLIARYGIALPEQVLGVLPTDLFDVPLDELLSDEGGNAVTQHLTIGYILSFLPSSLLHPNAVAVLSPRPLALLTNGDFATLLEGVQLGHLTGVTYDEAGNVQYKDPACPTMQEALAKLDLGHAVRAVTQNGDLLSVLATDLGDVEMGPVISGMISGELLEKMFAGRVLKDVILLNEETGRYELSFPALTEGLYLGDAMNYIHVDGVWYTTYTDNGDTTDDVPVGAMQAALADALLSDLVNGTFSVEQNFDGLYFGDLQNGYVRGEPITETPDGGESVVTGYEWSKDGAPVGKLQNALANIEVNTVLTGGLDINDAFSGLLFGDLQGFTYRELRDEQSGAVIGHKWYKTEQDGTETEVSSVLAAVSDVSLTTLLNGQLDLATVFGTLQIGDAQGYERGTDGRWYREVANGEGGTTPEYVGAVQNSLSNVPLSDVINGNFSLESALDGLRLGDAMNYTRGEIYEAADPDDPTSYDRYSFAKADGTEVTGSMLHVANIPLNDLISGKADIEDAMKDMTLAEALGYTNVDGVWYEEYTDADNNKPAEGVLAALADRKIKELNSEAVDGVYLGEMLNYTQVDGVWYEQYMDADNNKPATGVLAKMAQLTVGELSNADTVSTKLRELTLAEAMGYTQVSGVWYSTYSDDADDTNDVKVTGILAALAEKPLNQINSVTIDGIVLGVALGYEYRDSDSDGAADTWYRADGTVVEGIMGTVSDLKIGELSNPVLVNQKIDQVLLSDVLDYTYDKTDKRWEHPNGTPASGVVAHMLDINVKIGEMEQAIDDMQLGYALGLHQKDGEWLDANDQSPTGVFAGLANIHLSSAESELRALQIGRLMGYTGKDVNEDGKFDVWYYDDDDATNDPVTGLTKSFAGLLVTELGDERKIAAAMRDARLGDSLGYIRSDNGVWYHVTENASGNLVADTTRPVTGLIGSLAGESIGNIEQAIQQIAVGEMLDYTLVDGVWYEQYTDAANNKPAKGVLAVLASSNLSNLSENLGNLKVKDVWPERTGILSLLTGNEKITDLNTAVSEVFQTATMQQFVDAGVLVISHAQLEKLNQNPLFDGWEDWKFVEFFGKLIQTVTGVS